MRMSSGSVVRYLRPWGFRREQERQRLAALRERDGDDCRRCRRPLRFDLPRGHDQAPKLEQIPSTGGAGPLDHLCLCHTRCNAEARDNTTEVMERIQQRQETPAPKRRRAAAR